MFDFERTNDVYLLVMNHTHKIHLISIAWIILLSTIRKDYGSFPGKKEDKMIAKTHHKKMVKLISFVLVAFMALALVACDNKDKANGAAEAGETIKIGALAPLTGPVSVYGIATSRGARLAVDEINAADGINGKQIEYVEYDEKGNTEEAINAYNRLVNEDKVVALVGDVTTTPSIAVAQRAKEDNLPMITPTGTGVPITLQGPNVFRVCFIDPDQGHMMATYAAEKLDVSTAAVITNAADEYSVGLSEAFQEKAEELGIEILATETYNSEDVDFKTQLTKISQANPDVLYAPDYYGTNILVIQQAKQVGLDVPILGGDGYDGVLSVTAENNPEEADGVIFTNHIVYSDPAESIQNFYKSFTEKYDEDPISFSALGYDAVHLLAEAIEKAESTDNQAIIDAMKDINFAGITGNISFDENGDPIKEISIVTVENAEYKLVEKLQIER